MPDSKQVEATRQSWHGHKLKHEVWLFLGAVVIITVFLLIYLESTDFSRGCEISANEVISYTKSEPQKPFSSFLGPYKILTLPSEALVVRAAYLDPRPRDNFQNVTVFLVVIDKKLFARKREGIVACGTVNEVSTVLKIRLVHNVIWVHQQYPKITHDFVMIDCFGLQNTDSGIPAFLWFRLMNDGELYRVESEQPYFVPQTKDNKKQDMPTIVVCMAVLYGVPPFIREFVRYYEHLGVDHIYMMAEESFVRSGVLQADEYIQQVLKEGFISFSVWHYWLTTGKQVFYRSQMLSYQNCIYRFQGTYDYALLVDPDDHFIPLVPNQQKLSYYAKHFCEKGACVFRWIDYFPKCGLDWSKLGPNGNVTNTLLSYTSNVHYGNQGKALYRISAALDIGIHAPSQLMKGYKSQIVPSNKAYMAHVRINRVPKKGCSHADNS